MLLTAHSVTTPNMECKMKKYTFISDNAGESQTFEGVYKGFRFKAKFGVHVLILQFKGEENTFIEGDGWPTSEKVRKAIIEEYLDWF